MRFNARFPRLMDEEHTNTDVRTIANAGDGILSSDRRYDAVEYEKAISYSQVLYNI